MIKAELLLYMPHSFLELQNVSSSEWTLSHAYMTIIAPTHGVSVV